MKQSFPVRLAWWFEAGLLTILLSTTVVLSTTQIILRNTSSSSLEWADPVIQICVFWLGLIGAVAAARAKKHIRIDLLSRYLPSLYARIVDVLTALITCAIAGVIAWHAARLVISEKSFPTTVVFNIESWVVQLAMPISFGLIALLYLIDSIQGIFKQR